MLITNTKARFYSTEGAGEGANPITQNNSADANSAQIEPKPNQSDVEINFAKIRKENERLKKENEQFVKSKQEAENKSLEEQNKWKGLYDKEKQKSADYESQTKLNSQTSIVKDALEKAGVTPELRELLLPSLMTKVEFADDNSATNLDSVIADLPANLLTTPPAQAVGSSSVVGTTSQSSKMSIQEAIRMASATDVSEYTLNQKEVDEIISQSLIK
jgi:hypothetical protein